MTLGIARRTRFGFLTRPIGRNRDEHGFVFMIGNAIDEVVDHFNGVGFFVAHRAAQLGGSQCTEVHGAGLYHFNCRPRESRHAAAD